MEQVVHLFSNDKSLIKMVKEVLPTVTVRTHPIGAHAARSTGDPNSTVPPTVRLGLAGTPTKADAIVTKGRDTGLLQRFAMGKGTPYVVILPDAAEWLLTQVTGRGMSVLIGSDAARTWA